MSGLSENGFQSAKRLGKAPTIGVLVDWIGDPYQCGILAGMLEVLKPVGATLQCFAGGTLPTDPNSAARHRIFELVGPQSVDAVVVLTSTLAQKIGVPGVADYCPEHFDGIPLCSVGAHMAGRPSITTNNAFGIKSGRFAPDSRAWASTNRVRAGSHGEQ